MGLEKGAWEKKKINQAKGNRKILWIVARELLGKTKKINKST